MSLRDQLLKAGLTSQDQAKKLDADARKRDHQRKKQQVPAQQQAAQQVEAQRRAAQEVAEKRERDRQLNLAREAEKHRREQSARARQLIDSHRLNDADAEQLYNFWDRDRHWIRALRVLSPQCQELALGRLAIVQGDRHEFDYVLTSRQIAVKLTEFAAERVLLLHEESANPDSACECCE